MMKMEKVMECLLAKLEDKMNANAKGNQEDFLARMDAKQAERKRRWTPTRTEWRNLKENLRKLWNINCNTLSEKQYSL
jgi:hypothetical protein